MFNKVYDVIWSNQHLDCRETSTYFQIQVVYKVYAKVQIIRKIVHESRSNFYN